MPAVADEDIKAMFEHIMTDLHDISRRMSDIESKIQAWETRAEPLLRLRETASRMTTLGRGRRNGG